MDEFRGNHIVSGYSYSLLRKLPLVLTHTRSGWAEAGYPKTAP